MKPTGGSVAAFVAAVAPVRRLRNAETLISLLAFAPRRPASTVYLDASAHEDDLANLGPHTSGVSCLHLTDVEAVDLAVLRRIVERSYAATIGGELMGAEITFTG